MAIVTYRDPSGQQSAQDSLWHMAISDMSGSVNFKYVFDVFDSYNNHLIRSKVYPDVNDGWGYFDAGSVIRNEINYAWFKVRQDQVVCHSLTDNDNVVSYTVQVGQEYNIGASRITTLNDASGDTTVYNYFPGPFTRRLTDMNHYSTYFGKYYTNRPLTANVSWKDDLMVAVFMPNSYTLEVKKYNEYGTLLSTNSKSKDFGAYTITQLNIGMEALNGEFGSAIFSSADDSGYYTVKLNGKIFTVNMQCQRDYQVVNLHFMNGLGVFDTARFDCANKLSMTTNRKKYSRKDVSFYYGTANYYDDNLGNRPKVYNETGINYAQDVDWSYKLMMNFPTDAEWEWLYELILSPQIYMEIDNKFFPVTIKNTNYEYNKQLWAKLKTFEIEIEVNQKRNGFRR